MSYFLYKLLPPRPTFAKDMTADEAKIMQVHGAYWKTLVDEGKVVIVGPVIDGQGGWGLAIVEAESEAEVRAIGDKDPAVTSKHGLKFEVYPMLRAMLRKA